MKTHIDPLSIIGLSLLALGAIQSTSPAFADNTPLQEGSATIQITMPAGQSVFMQHQPIVLHYDIVNPSASPIHIETTARDMDGALGSDAWMQVSLLDDRGHSVPQQDDVHGLSTSGFGTSYSQRIDPGVHLIGNIVPSRWFKPPGIGKYTLVLVADQSAFRFPITIVADDHGRLKTIARQIGAEVLNAEEDDKRRSLIQTICVFPAADALPVWQQLSQSPKCRGMIARELAREPSPIAADILAKSAWSGDMDERVHSGRLLDTMYNEGDPALRAHIKSLFAQHGMTTLPDKLVLTEDGG